jgi:hypothetical protein
VSCGEWVRKDGCPFYICLLYVASFEGKSKKYEKSGLENSGGDNFTLFFLKKNKIKLPVTINSHFLLA